MKGNYMIQNTQNTQEIYCKVAGYEEKFPQSFLLKCQDGKGIWFRGGPWNFDDIYLEYTLKIGNLSQKLLLNSRVNLKVLPSAKKNCGIC